MTYGPNACRPRKFVRQACTSTVQPLGIAYGDHVTVGMDCLCEDVHVCAHSGLHTGQAHRQVGTVARRRWNSLVVARVIDTRDSTTGVHEFSISFLCRPEQCTDMLHAQLLPPGGGYGMPSTPETGRLACTNAVSSFNTARGSVVICYARSYRRLGKGTVCHRRPRQDVCRVRMQYLD